MRAIGFASFGAPEVLKVLDLPDRRPGPGQIRIRVSEEAISPTDTLLRPGYNREGLDWLAPPYIPGMDAVSVVDAVGEGVSAWQYGDEVMAMVIPYRPEGGAYAEQLVVPAGASMTQASTLPMNALTARTTLDRLALAPGATPAVTGAAGAFAVGT